MSKPFMTVTSFGLGVTQHHGADIRRPRQSAYVRRTLPPNSETVRNHLQMRLLHDL
jgi:hypothetical protein